MLRSLRKKFILIAMLSVSFVLLIIISGINISSYFKIIEFADERISIIESNGGTFPKDNVHENAIPGNTVPGQPSHPIKPQKKPSDGKISLEASFDTRYFTVCFDSTGNVTRVDTVKISSVDENQAQKIAVFLYEKGKTSGFFDEFRYKTIDVNGNTMYIFLNCEREFASFYTFLLSSVIISFIGILIVFILVLFFSRLALRPVAEAYEKQKQFITNAGHEIKTPITVISANAEVIESINGESEWTKSIKRQSGRLRDLTDKLIYLSRTEETGNSISTYEFSLSEALREECASFEPLAAIEGKNLTVSIEENVRYKGDEASLCNMISILLENALKYSSESSDIFVSLRTLGKAKEITVKNSVDVVEVGKLDHFFERFYRGDKSHNSENRGHGIGLAIAKAIVMAHKGKISAKSPDGRSVIFTVIL